jgi:trehalose 6-phosphate phosphatase
VTTLPLTRSALSSALVALDFDGTLAPISPHPDDARPLAGVHELLCDVRATGATLAVISGRSVTSLLRISNLAAVPGIIIYGTHGVERWENGHLREPVPPPGLEDLRRSLPALVISMAGDSAIWVEEKGLSLVIHTRLTADPDAHLEQLRAPVAEAAAAAGLETRPGKEVLEICIPGYDKGTAIRELIGGETAAVLYAGDDVGDLPALHEVNAWSSRTGRPKLAVAITSTARGPLTGLTDVTVPDPQAFMSLLRQILQ